MSGVGHMPRSHVPAWLGRPCFEKRNVEAFMMPIFTSLKSKSIIALSCQGRTTAPKGKETKRARFKQAAERSRKTNEGATCSRKHIWCYNLHVGRQARQAQNAKRAVKKQRLRAHRKEQAGRHFKRSLRLSRKFLFDWRCQDVEAWRDQKAKDVERQKNAERARRFGGRSSRSYWRCDALSKFEHDAHNACSIRGRGQ